MQCTASKSIKTKTTYWENKLSAITEYDKDGNVIKMEAYNRKGTPSPVRSNRIVIENGIKKDQYFKIEPPYIDQDTIVTETCILDIRTGNKKFQFTPNGDTTFFDRIVEADTITEYEYKSRENFQQSDWDSYEKWIQNKKGKKELEFAIKSRKRGTIEKTEYVYNAKGMKVKKIRTGSKNEIHGFICDKKKRVTKIYPIESESTLRDTFAYNKYGDLIMMKKYGRLSNKPYEVKYNYIYEYH